LFFDSFHYNSQQHLLSPTMSEDNAIGSVVLFVYTFICAYNCGQILMKFLG